MPSTFTDLLLAYRQAKTALFFERRGIGLYELAQFEQQLQPRLHALNETLDQNGGWFDSITPGEVYLVPKKLRLAGVREGEPIRIGTSKSVEACQGLDVSLWLSPTPEFAILEILYLWRFGPALDALLSPSALGYRIDLRDGQIRKSSRWLFEYWPRRYQQFRSSPLKVARSHLSARDASVVIISADLANFYDTVEPSFLIDDQFLESLVAAARSRARPIDIDEYQLATRSLLSAFERFRRVARQRTGLDWATGIPIGALTSRLVSNVALATLDDAVLAQRDVLSYYRYVDDIVIVGRTEPQDRSSLDETISRFLPQSASSDGSFLLDPVALRRPGSAFELRREKCFVHHLTGPKGDDFLAVIQRDFRSLVSERRAFLDSATIIGDAAREIVRAGSKSDGPLRVLRDADRTKIEHFALSTAMASLERISALVDADSARTQTRQSLEGIQEFLSGDDDWVRTLDVAMRLLRLAVSIEDGDESRALNVRMDRIWGTAAGLRAAVGTLFHRNRPLTSARGWVWLRNYLHARRIDAVSAALRPPSPRHPLLAWLNEGVLSRTRVIRGKSLVKRARLLAAADLRARDREDDSFGASQRVDTEIPIGEADADLNQRLARIRSFTDLAARLGDSSWNQPALRLFLSTRPPSYFDVARRWLYRSESAGFQADVFDELLRVVNAIRGTDYSDPIGRVVGENTVAIAAPHWPFAAEAGLGSDPRLLLGNLTASEADFDGAATRVSGNDFGKPNLSMTRLVHLARVLRRAESRARDARTDGNRASLLVLPELSLPRTWFRAVANYVVRNGEFGLIAGLEYRHNPAHPWVFNQVHAVLPGPYASVATWPWTKRNPARDEAALLAKKRVGFKPASTKPAPRRTVVHGAYGRFSVLICSELIEARLIADLVGRVELLLVPSWNRDTASYDHLVRSAGLQLHAIVAVANNAAYSDCRAWAPLTERPLRDLCRLIERGVDDVVFADLPIVSLTTFHQGREPARGARWRALPPEWPVE